MGTSQQPYVEQFPAPTLKPGQIVGHLPAHKVAGLRQAIEATGATPRLLPPRSQDLNPIEQLFAKLSLRRAATQSVAALWTHVSQILTAFRPDDAPVISLTPDADQFRWDPLQSANLAGAERPPGQIMTSPPFGLREAPKSPRPR